jgi:hypothetical protein
VETYYKDPHLDTENVNVLAILRVMELAFCAFFLVHYLLQFLAAKKKLSYVFSWIALLDLVTILPVALLLLESNPDVTAEQTETVFVFVRFVRVLRIMRLATAQRMLTYLDSEISQQIFRLGLTALILTFITAGLLHLVENIESLWPLYTRPYPFGLQFHDAFYLVVTTVTTVGYGDISPKTDPGRVIIMVMMATVVILIPQQTNKLIAIMSLSNIYSRQRYKYSPHASHVIVCGMINGNGACFLEFYTELFHPDHNSVNLHAVVIADGLPSPDIQALLSSPRYSFGLTYLDGNVLNPKDLRRAAAQHAKSFFVLSNKFSPNPEEDDASTILRALAIKRFVQHTVQRDIQTCVQLISTKSKKLFQSSAVGSSLNRRMRTASQIVCVDEIKLNLLAKSCLCPGASTMLCNLITSSGDEAVKGPKWLQEYCEGCGYEVYRVALAPAFAGHTFLEAAHTVYKETGSALFALELNLGGGAKPRVALSPGNFVIPPCQQYGVFGFVIAEDKKDADEVAHVFNETTPSPGGFGSPKSPKKGASAVAPTMPLSLPRPGEAAPYDAEVKEGDAVVRSTESTKIAKLMSFDPGPGTVSLQDKYHLLPHPTSLDEATIKSIPDEMPDMKDHIILLGGATNLFSFILPLRSKQIDKIQPIVILRNTAPRRSEWKRIGCFPQVFFVRGSTLEQSDMKRVRASHASRVVVFAKMSSGTTTNNDALVDADAIFAYRVLQKMNDRIQIIVELVTQSNVSFLCEVDPKAGGQEEHYQSPPYAAGHVYNASMLDTLLCQSYYNPHIITILRHIVAGGDPWAIHQFNTDAMGKTGPLTDSHLFQIPIPVDFGGETYGDLYAHLVKTRATLPLGLRRGVQPTGVGKVRLLFTMMTAVCLREMQQRFLSAGACVKSLV